MIITLAGHVDHGKTSLVKALTGTDTDRLKEEKARGLTIDLGFAYRELNGKRVGFVDVPGHHRFVHNMVAGVAEHQYALLVIAADDGPMPQTVEHLNILKLCGLERGCIVLTKSDLVTQERLEACRESIAALITNSFLESASVFTVSSQTGTGIDTLLQHLDAAAETSSSAQSRRNFRLAIDRVFNIKGAGLVVTGTVTSGRLTQATQLLATWNSGKAATKTKTGTKNSAFQSAAVRMRSLHVNNLPATSADVGDRCALNLTGVSKRQLSRGSWLIEPEALAPVYRCYIDLTWVEQPASDRRTWRSLHIHHATSHVTAQMRLVATDFQNEQGSFAELLLDAPIQAKHGDRLVIRDAAAETTLAGGRVLRVHSQRKRARGEQPMLDLGAYVGTDPEACLLELMKTAGDLDTFEVTWNLPEEFQQHLLTQLQAQVIDVRGNRRLHTNLQINELKRHLYDYLEKLHQTQPQLQGLNLKELEAGFTGVSRELLLRAVTDAVNGQQLAISGNLYHLKTHRAQAPKADPVLEKFRIACQNSLQPPSLGDLAISVGIQQDELQRKLVQLTRQKRLIQTSPRRFFLPDRIRTLAEKAIQLEQEAGNFTVRNFRDFTGLGRNVAIEVLEEFDRRGFTRRLADRRSIIRDIGVVID